MQSCLRDAMFIRVKNGFDDCYELFLPYQVGQRLEVTPVGDVLSRSPGAHGADACKDISVSWLTLSLKPCDQ